MMSCAIQRYLMDRPKVVEAIIRATCAAVSVPVRMHGLHNEDACCFLDAFGAFRRKREPHPKHIDTDTGTAHMLRVLLGTYHQTGIDLYP